MDSNCNNIRIGILTFHRSINYGAFLQSYALSTTVASSFPDAKVEIIDYCPLFEIKKYETSLKNFVFGSKYEPQSLWGAFKNIAKLVLMPGILGQKKSLNNSFKKSYKHLPLSQKQWITDDFEQFLSDIKNDYDIVIVGSDAVWEYKVFPFPNAYFLNDKINCIKMSYAACSGRMSYSETDERQRNLLCTFFNSFDYIGIRDQATEKFLHQIDCNLQTHHNCDPSFFLDINNDPLFNKSQVSRLLIERGIDLNKPIIGIMGGNEMGKMIRSFWGDKYQIVAVYYPNQYADVYLPELTPFEWAVVFSFLKITITRYFHGTIYSLKNGTPTNSIDDWSLGESDQYSKLEDVLIRTDLKSHYFKASEMRTESGRKKIKESAEKFITEPDSNETVSGLEKESRYYKEFETALGLQIESAKEKCNNV